MDNSILMVALMRQWKGGLKRGYTSGLGIYKRKKENKKTRTRLRKHARVHEKKNSLKKKQALDQESVHEKKNSFKKILLSTTLYWFVDPTN